MQFSGLPNKFPRPFGASAASTYIRTIPDTTTDPNAASFTLAFPPNTFTDISAGGEPMDGRDLNGILFAVTAWLYYLQAGTMVTFDAGVAAAGGYPKYALLASTTPGVFWQSTADNNTTNPDGGSPANWVMVAATRATYTDVRAGTADNKFITPLALATAFGSTPNQLIYPNGVKECWGEVTLTSAGEPLVPVTLPFSFTDTTYNIQLTPMLLTPSVSKDTWVQAVDSTKTINGFSVQYQHPGTPESPSYGLDGFYWRVTGT